VIDPERLREERRWKFLAALEEGYSRYSVVPSATKSRPFNDPDDANLAFSQIAFSEAVPETWFTDPQEIADMYFYETGQAISIAEENHIVAKIQTALPTPSSLIEPPNERNIAQTIRGFCTELLRKVHQPPFRFAPVLFAPIRFMTPMMLWMDGSVPWFQVKNEKDFVRVDPITWLEVIWSNNYVEFSDFFLLDREQFAEWIYKPENGNRLITNIQRRDSDYAMIAKTVFNYKITNPEAALRIGLSRASH